MMEKQEISRPKLIAYSNGCTILPFENVKYINGDTYPDRGETLSIYIEHKHGEVLLSGDDVGAFIKQYNEYLAFVEAATVTNLMGESDE